jgi:uncharacterized protein YdhG (YjbR/CyaY superfamily)
MLSAATIGARSRLVREPEQSQADGLHETFDSFFALEREAVLGLAFPRSVPQVGPDRRLRPAGCMGAPRRGQHVGLDVPPSAKRDPHADPARGAAGPGPPRTLAEKSTTPKDKMGRGWTPEERAAAKAYAQELKAEARGANDERAALAAIAAMPPKDRAMGKRIHAIVKASAPDLAPKTWYGMPAYAKDGKVICFLQSADKFKARYATFGFNDTANLDEGNIWPTPSR